MKPRIIDHSQGRLFEHRLSDQLNPLNELYVLSGKIDWAHLEQAFVTLFSNENGAPGKPVRLVVGLLMLQHLYGISDEQVVFQWVENPYWQFFCGYDYLQWTLPTHPTALGKWRKRLGPEGLEKVLASTIKTALVTEAVKPSSLKSAIVDTTVMNKNIAYPTDSGLYYKGLRTLVRLAERYNIPLKRTYSRLAKQALRKFGQYAHARQMQRAQKECKRLKRYLRRVFQEMVDKITGNIFLEARFKKLFEIITRVLTQEKHSPNKVYSIHEPETECISKGKPHKKYEFGCKTSLVITHKEGLALSTAALHGNPYDGHTLQEALKKAEELSGTPISKVFVDKGYRGHGIEDRQVFISGQKKGLTRWFKGQLKRRQAIEPQIGHMKSDGKLDRNFLKGSLGDKLNAILCGIGHNLRLIVRWIGQQVRLPDLSYA